MRFAPIPGVFSPISDSWLLARALESEPLPPSARVLDVCTGSGVMAIAAARRGWEATAIDASRRAVIAAWLNARLNGTRVRALRGSLFEPVRGERFDVIVSNPPYVPSEDAQLPSRGVERAWGAGPDGRALMDPIIDRAPGFLRPGGSLMLVHSEINGIEETARRMESGGLVPEVVARHRGPLGPLLSDRAAELEAKGLLAPSQRAEDVVVIRGRAPSADSPKLGD